MIALDLEATLIDSAIEGNPRPGLFSFVQFCLDEFDRVALLTTVDEADARDVLYALADQGAVPEKFAGVEYIHWQGEFKDLRFAEGIEPHDILFVDDDQGWVHPEQIAQWIAIEPWSGGEDSELTMLKNVLTERLREKGS